MVRSLSKKIRSFLQFFTGADSFQTFFHLEMNKSTNRESIEELKKLKL